MTSSRYEATVCDKQEQRQKMDDAREYDWHRNSSRLLDEQKDHDKVSIPRQHQLINNATYLRPQRGSKRGQSHASVRSALLSFQKTEQLLAKIQSRSPSDRLAALLAIQADFSVVKALIVRMEGLQALVDALAFNSQSHDATRPSPTDQAEWKSAVWEILLMILYNLDALSLDIHDIGHQAIVVMLSLVQKEREDRHRCLALRFLLVESNRSILSINLIVQSGGVSLLVKALSIERDQPASRMLLQLLRLVKAADPRYEQAINSSIQEIATDKDQCVIEYANLLLLVHQQQMDISGLSPTTTDDKKQFSNFMLQESMDTLMSASSSLIHKFIALKCVQRALPEIAFAFVFDHDGIRLLLDILMQRESTVLDTIAVHILQLLARQDDAFRGHVLKYYSRYIAAQRLSAEIKAESIRKAIFDDRRQQCDTSLVPESDALSTASGKAMRPKESGSDLDGDSISGCVADPDTWPIASNFAADMLQSLAFEELVGSSIESSSRLDKDWESIS